MTNHESGNRVIAEFMDLEFHTINNVVGVYNRRRIRPPR